MSDETTPGLRDLILAVLDRAPEQRTGRLIDELADALQPELDRRDAEIAKLRKEVERRGECAIENGRCADLAESALEAAEDLAARQRQDHRAELAEAEKQIRATEAERDQLAQRIPYKDGETEEQYLERQVARWRSETYDARVRAKAAEAERDQLKAATARVREIHPREPNGFGDVCLICFDEEGEFAPWPCPTIAALDQPEGPGTCICQPGKKPTYGCRVHGWAASRDQPGDLAAVREFVANLDPREM